MLKLTQELIQDRLVISLEGELALETQDQFHALWQQSIPGVRKVELDCRGLTFIDSTGVNALMQAFFHWRKAGAEAELTNLADDLGQMLTVLGFFDVLSEQV